MNHYSQPNNSDFFNNSYNNQFNNSGNQFLNPKESKRILDPYTGYIRGNMFDQTYDGYSLKNPIEIKPLNEQADMLTYIDALGFALTDIALYLDIFPNNEEMINIFNNYRNERNEMVKNYEKKYGPLTLNGEISNTRYWAWGESPWPWEGV